MNRRKWILSSVAVFASVGIAIALAPSCTAAWWTIIYQATAIVGGNQTTGVQTTHNLCQYEITGTIYHDRETTSAGLGQWNANPAKGNLGYCYPQFGSYVDFAVYSGQNNRFHNQVFNTVINDHWPTVGPFCAKSGVINDRQDYCVSEPCCGPGTGVGCGSPLVGDPHGVGFDGNLTSVSGGRKFDFNNTGKPIQMAWIKRGAGLYFLAYDWDHDGGPPRDGHDLIGTTSCPNAKNGFVAFEKLDSNHDRKITPEDDAWPKLRWWDGYSDKTLPIQAFGYKGFSLNYTKQPPAHEANHDSNGNGLSLWAKAFGVLPDPWIVDVYFVEGKGY